MKRYLFLALLTFILLGAGCESQPTVRVNSLSEVKAESVVITSTRPIKETPVVKTQVKEVIPGPALATPVKQTKSQTTDYAPNGAYTNTAGNEVPSPYEAPPIPAGASAQCRDGTYSFSQNRRGTCSHHGGVAEWY